MRAALILTLCSNLLLWLCLISAPICLARPGRGLDQNSLGFRRRGLSGEIEEVGETSHQPPVAPEARAEGQPSLSPMWIAQSQPRLGAGAAVTAPRPIDLQVPAATIKRFDYNHINGLQASDSSEGLNAKRYKNVPFYNRYPIYPSDTDQAIIEQALKDHSRVYMLNPSGPNRGYVVSLDMNHVQKRVLLAVEPRETLSKVFKFYQMGTNVHKMTEFGLKSDPKKELESELTVSHLPHLSVERGTRKVPIPILQDGKVSPGQMRDALNKAYSEEQFYYIYKGTGKGKDKDKEPAIWRFWRLSAEEQEQRAARIREVLRGAGEIQGAPQEPRPYFDFEPVEDKEVRDSILARLRFAKPYEKKYGPIVGSLFYGKPIEVDIPAGTPVGQGREGTSATDDKKKKKLVGKGPFNAKTAQRWDLIKATLEKGKFRVYKNLKAWEFTLKPADQAHPEVPPTYNVRSLWPWERLSDMTRPVLGAIKMPK